MGGTMRLYPGFFCLEWLVLWLFVLPVMLISGFANWAPGLVAAVLFTVVNWVVFFWVRAVCGLINWDEGMRAVAGRFMTGWGGAALFWVPLPLTGFYLATVAFMVYATAKHVDRQQVYFNLVYEVTGYAVPDVNESASAAAEHIETWRIIRETRPEDAADPDAWYRRVVLGEMPDGTTELPQALPDWYTDPAGRHQYRFWDGDQWTERVLDNEDRGSDPL